jgi:hypothetical protein
MIKINTLHTIDVGDFDQLVVDTYGRVYNFQQQDGCKSRGLEYITVPSDGYLGDYDNDTIPDEVNGEERGVSFSAWLARDPKEWYGIPDQNTQWYIDLFWARNFYPSVDMVINDLHAKGLLPAGEYAINIDW